MRSKSENWLLGLGLAYVVSMPILISAALGWKQMPALVHALGGQTAAAWTQAIGSVLAIVGAIYIGRNQARHAAAIAEKQANQATDHRNEALAIPISAAAWAVNAAKQFTWTLVAPGVRPSIEDVKRVADNVDICAGFLLEIHLETMATGRAAHALMQARITVAAIQRILGAEFNLTHEELSALYDAWDTLSDAEVQLQDEAMAAKYGTPYED